MDDDFYNQKNCYFDTPTQDLQKKKFGLRIREYQTYGELTLKTPAVHGLLETTDTLTIQQTKQLINEQKILASGAVADVLIKHQIQPKDLHMTAQLTTKRAEIQLPEGLLALDESWYGNGHDYELELEVASIHEKENFEKILSRWRIDYQPAPNKIMRALNEARQQNE